MDEAGNRSRFSETDYRDQADFRYAIRNFLRFSELQAREAGITPNQHLLLLLVRGHPSYPHVAIGEIAERLQINQSGASLLVERCVKRGLITRQEDPQDRRRAILALTAEGQQILDDVTEANRQEMGILEGSLFRDSLRDALARYQEVAQDRNVV